MLFNGVIYSWHGWYFSPLVKPCNQIPISCNLWVLMLENGKFSVIMLSQVPWTNVWLYYYVSKFNENFVSIAWWITQTVGLNVDINRVHFLQAFINIRECSMWFCKHIWYARAWKTALLYQHIQLSWNQSSFFADLYPFFLTDALFLISLCIFLAVCLRLVRCS